MSARRSDGGLARPAAAGTRLSHAILAGTSLLLTSTLLVSRLPLLATRRFDPDELEHAHVAWYLLQGAVPYRDFFEHHTPVFHYLLAGLLSFFHPEQSADAAMRALVVARSLAWVMSVAIVALTFVYARRLRGSTTAWVALPIAAGSIVMALRAIEIRPDGLSTTLWLTSLIALHAGMDDDAPASRRSRWRFAAAGLAFGVATLTSQKLLLAGPPLLVIAGWFLLRGGSAAATRDRAIALSAFAAAAAMPWLVAIAAFATAGAGGSFLHRTVFESLGWKSENRATSLLAFVMRYEPWLFALTAAGCVVLIDRARRGQDRAASTVLLLVPALGMLFGLFVMPVPFAQYCLTFLPLFAIIGASALVEGARRLAALERLRFGQPSAGALAAAIAVISLAAIGVFVSRPVIVTPVIYPVVIGVALVVLLTLPRYRRPEIALAVMLFALTLFPLQWTRWLAALGDEGQFAEIRYVLDHTGPGDVVMDGWSGSGVFRRHAAYYWMLHPGVRAMLTPADVEGIVRPVIDESIRPAAVVLDDNLRQLSPPLTAFVERTYRPAGVGRVFVRESR